MPFLAQHLILKFQKIAPKTQQFDKFYNVLVLFFGNTRQTEQAVPHFGCQSKNLCCFFSAAGVFSNAPPGIKKKLRGCKMTNAKASKSMENLQYELGHNEYIR